MIFDGHSDIWTDVTIRRLNGETDILNKYHTERLRKGKIEGSIFVIWVDPPFDHHPKKRSIEIMNGIKSEVSECDEILIVYNYEDIIMAKELGKIYIFIGLEGLSYIGDDISQIDELYNFGARHAMLSWNETNLLATGAHGDSARGLTNMGIVAVKKIQELGMILDVSHLNDRSFWDVMGHAEQPIIASHSNARAICNAQRNLSDDMIREIGRTGGLIGVNAANFLVHDNKEKWTVDSLIDNMIHVADLIGTEHLGFGFDFYEFLEDNSIDMCGGTGCPSIMGLEDCSKIPNLIACMSKRGFTSKEIEDIQCNNWHRIIKTILK